VGASEIRQLRQDLERLSRKQAARRIESELDRAEASSNKRIDPTFNAQRLLRLSEEACNRVRRQEAMRETQSSAQHPMSATQKLSLEV
jgi:hypothetical protein